jgi:hypothetical protein
VDVESSNEMQKKVSARVGRKGTEIKGGTSKGNGQSTMKEGRGRSRVDGEGGGGAEVEGVCPEGRR